jgi:hypothetical protein
MEACGSRVILEFRLMQHGRTTLELDAGSTSSANEWYDAIEAEVKRLSRRRWCAASGAMAIPSHWNIDTLMPPDAWRFPERQGAPRRFAKVPLRDAERISQIQRLVDHCYVGKSTRDRKGNHLPTRLQVEEVVQIQHIDNWKRYESNFIRVVGSLCPDDRSLWAEKIDPDLLTCALANELDVLPLIQHEQTERWVFHGTTIKGLDGIVEDDFDIEKSGSNGGTLYGSGIYTAECSSKADEYTEENSKGLRALLLCRATLGRILYVDDKHVDKIAVTRQRDARYCHTIVGDRLKANGTFREFVLSDRNQVYPEFIIFYRRVM